MIDFKFIHNLNEDLLQEHFLLKFQVVFSLSLIENMCNGDFLNFGLYWPSGTFVSHFNSHIFIQDCVEKIHEIKRTSSQDVLFDFFVCHKCSAMYLWLNNYYHIKGDNIEILTKIQQTFNCTSTDIQLQFNRHSIVIQ